MSTHLEEPLGRKLIHIEGLVKAMSDDFLRRQLEAEIADLSTQVACLIAATRVVEDQNRCLLRRSRRDDLTELYNQRYLTERLDEEFRRSIRYRTPLSLLVGDLDDFRLYNDTWGHLVGNQLLRRVGRVIRQTVRDTDVPARYGGDEFVIILPQTGEDQAAVLAERLRLAIADMPDTVGVSIGIAALTPDITGPHKLIAHADSAMLQAKAQGKNRIVHGMVPSWISGRS